MKKASIPNWLHNSSPVFKSITRTDDELSIVSSKKFTLILQTQERQRRCFKVMGPLDFSLTGIISSIAKPPANGGISIFTIATYDTDYIMIKQKDLEKTIETLGMFCKLC